MSTNSSTNHNTITIELNGSPTTIEVTNTEGTTTVEAQNIVLATGSRPIQVPGFGT